MKSFAIACAALAAMVSTAAAGDLAVSKSTLGNMGLGSMTTMSDEDGMTVRGKGTFANVWGASEARWTITDPNNPNNYVQQISANNYEAGASWVGKRSSAIGGNLSFAGQTEIQYLMDPTGSQLSVLAAGGIAGGLAGATAW
ncbi:MAG: hypothetical protein DWQ37_10380 [Planctomycetota bacterium]|nr:MAG: hypothetical protein DWQ37_10380 [Planctomycetota bacterium]